MRKIMSANEAASRSEEVKAQYCDINAYNDFMEMLADEIKIAVNNGWTSTMPLRWGYLPDGYANKVITELSELGYKVSTIEDKMTVSWYDRKLHKYESESNYFNDKNFANQVALHQLLYRKLLKYAYDNEFEDEEWDETKMHAYIIYNFTRKDYDIRWTRNEKEPGTVYFKTPTRATAALSEVVMPFVKEHPEFVW